MRFHITPTQAWWFLGASCALFVIAQAIRPPRDR